MKKTILFATIAGLFLASCSKSDMPSISKSKSVTLRGEDGSTISIDTTMNGITFYNGKSFSYNKINVDRTSTGTTNYMSFQIPGNTPFYVATLYKSLAAGKTDSTLKLVFTDVNTFPGRSFSN